MSPPVDEVPVPRLVPTPSQTYGPYGSMGFHAHERRELVPATGMGVLHIEGRLLDGAGAGVPDGAVEIWQADAEGRFPPSTEGGWSGFGRCLTAADGGYAFVTVKPGAVPLESGELQAPHVELLLFARGLLRPVRTRLYFPDEPTNATDAVLSGIDPERRSTLVADDLGGRRLRFDVRLQGERETVFFGF